MRYDVILFTRGLSKSEDYHWCNCPEYVNRKALYDYLQPLSDYVKNCTREISTMWKEQYVFLNLTDCSLCIRLYESEYTDFCDRSIFVIEGVVCSSVDRNFMFHDLVNVICCFEKNQQSIQDIYYQQGECSWIDIPDFIYPKVFKEDGKVETYANIVRFIQHQSRVCNVLIGNQDSITSFLFQQYQLADIESVSEVIYQSVKEECAERKKYDVRLEVKFGKKWIAEYAFKVCDAGTDSVYARTESDFFDTRIEYANLYAKKKLLHHIMNVLWG